jgi:hypothetical protein
MCGRILATDHSFIDALGRNAEARGDVLDRHALLVMDLLNA